VLSGEPSGNVTEMHAASIGARSQSARTYLENHLDEFKTADADATIAHALRALKETITVDSGRMDENVSYRIAKMRMLIWTGNC
jgi:20S proteasome subunit alpha 6